MEQNQAKERDYKAKLAQLQIIEEVNGMLLPDIFVLTHRLSLWLIGLPDIYRLTSIN